MKTARSTARGFTLIEVLVASSILVLLVLLFTQIISGASNAVGVGTGRLEADAEARRVLSQITRDVQGMVKRPDVPAILTNTPSGNSRLQFYSSAPGFADQSTAQDGSTLSYVDYRVGTGNENAHLQRLSALRTWDNLPFGQSNLVAPATGIGTNQLGRNVLRFEVKALARPTRTGSFAYTNAFPNTPASTDLIDWDNVQALNVAIVTLDTRSADSIPRASREQIRQAIGAFFPAASGTNLPAADWQNKANELASGSASVPGASPNILRNLRVYQATIPLR